MLTRVLQGLDDKLLIVQEWRKHNHKMWGSVNAMMPKRWNENWHMNCTCLTLSHVLVSTIPFKRRLPNMHVCMYVKSKIRQFLNDIHTHIHLHSSLRYLPIGVGVRITLCSISQSTNMVTVPISIIRLTNSNPNHLQTYTPHGKQRHTCDK